MWNKKFVPASKLNAKHHNQRGVSLLTVMIIMLLGLLMVLGSSRVTLLNEKMAGNSTDYQRAFEATEALLSDARLDLLNCFQGGCATRSATTGFVCSREEFEALRAILSPLNPQCRDGVCLDLGVASNGDPSTSFWNIPARFTDFTTNNNGVRFGQFTNTPIAVTNAINPLLSNNAWYWIEILEYGTGSGRAVKAESHFSGSQKLVSDCDVLFRVTAVAQGRKPGTTAVLQTIYTVLNPTP